ncbi:MAG: hypothetical protein V2A56_04545 [bacterium]
MNKLTRSTLLAFLLIFTGCAAQTSLEPLGKGNTHANVGFGGPIIEVFGTHLPVPYLTAGVVTGVSERVNGAATLHLLPLAYEVAGLDLSTSWFPILQEQRKPTIGLQARLMGFVSLRSGIGDRFRIYPMVTPTLAWRKGSRLYYGGSDLVLPMTLPDYDSQSVKAIFSPFLGVKWRLGSNLWLSTEMKWQGANAQSDQLAVKYLPVAGHGAISTLVALEWGLR